MRSRFLTLFFAFSVLLAIAPINNPAAAQGRTDPYANSYQQGLAMSWEQELTTYLSAVRNLSFAASCDVFIMKWNDVQNILNPTESRLVWTTRQLGPQVGEPMFNRWKEQKNAAMVEGVTRAKSEGCGYWQEHPQAVYQMRQLAGTSRGR